MDTFRTLYGIDFSGAEQNAGRLIWICRVAIDNDSPLVESCLPGADLSGSGPLRTECLTALCRFIAQHDSQTLFGLDFPFSLPRPIIEEGDWHGFVNSFDINFADCESFRGHCRETTAGRELKRQTDVETLTPFSPYNLV